MSGTPESHAREVDPVTGYDTTGHDWGGIKELNTPFPRIALVALALSFLIALSGWILLPAWPYGRDFTRGLLGLDQGEMAQRGARAMAEIRAGWLGRFTTPDGGAPDFEALAGDAALMAQAMPAANRLFEDNCALCHARDGGGGPGFPVLDDGHWLWGGAPEDIAETLRVGINAEHPETRIAQMPAFDWMDRAERAALADYVAALPTGRADSDAPGAALFAENCAACHGEGGEGGLGIGAPSLIDSAVIYGQDPATVLETITRGRAGVMPNWSDRLSAAEINLLALYVAWLSGGKER